MYFRVCCLSVEVFRTVRATAAAVGPGAAPRRARATHTVKPSPPRGPKAGGRDWGDREGGGEGGEGGKEGRERVGQGGQGRQGE